MNAVTASKAALTFGWLLAAAAYIGTGSAAPARLDPGAPPPAAAHPKIGKTECAECHGELTAKANVHAAAADCTTCHVYSETPGSDEGTVKLAGEGSALCFACHADLEQALGAKKHAHEPAKGDCTMCHDPHSSDNARLLKGSQQDLCGTCHTDVLERMAGAKFVHQPLKDLGCSVCHDPHASDAALMLKADDVEALCMSCHRWEDAPNPANKTRKRILETSDGRGHPVTGHPYKGIADPSTKDGMITCMSCHDPHAGPNRPRLKDGKVKGDFCSRCH